MRISPPFIEQAVRSGRAVTDAISVTNAGDGPLTVSVELADFTVEENGLVRELPPATSGASLVPFLRVVPSKVRLEPGERAFFRYRVTPPADFAQLRAMIYFLAVPAGAAPDQVVVAPRLGVPLYLESVDAPPAMLEVEGLTWRRAQDDALEFEVTTRNGGSRNIRPAGTIDVRTPDGSWRRTFPFNEGRSPVLPGNVRRWEGRVGPVPEGELTIEFRIPVGLRESWTRSGTVDPLR